MDSVQLAFLEGEEALMVVFVGGNLSLYMHHSVPYFSFLPIVVLGKLYGQVAGRYVAAEGDGRLVEEDAIEGDNGVDALSHLSELPIALPDR